MELSLLSMPLLLFLLHLHPPLHGQTIQPKEQRLKEEAIISKQILQAEVLEDFASKF